ncbi:hypothetical protein EcWSU1_03654 [Enterobacter ludwigii]|uniref:Uncharacterized protein n=1 Tax=Enterobacter ludwigii TaxID=299767 RepID=G8LD76_9ENTR|nr:hypothetical protein EcWSU1_03654 [Enterobacter ludwigii]
MLNCLRLAQIVNRDVVHVIKDLVFTDHTPDEGVRFRAYARMNRPARRNNRLLVMHHDMARFLRLPHHVEHAGVLVHVEVEIHFHTALVGMARHGVPQVARSKLGQPHAELAGFQHIRNKVFIDGATVAGEVVTQRHRGDIRRGHFFGGIRGMCGRTVVVKLRRFTAVDAGEHDLFRPFTDIQRVAMTYLIALSVYGDGAGATDVNHAQLATLKEIAHTKLFTHFSAHGDGLRHRHNPANDNTVDMAVDHGVLIGLEHLLD